VHASRAILIDLEVIYVQCCYLCFRCVFALESGTDRFLSILLCIFKRFERKLGIMKRCTMRPWLNVTCLRGPGHVSEAVSDSGGWSNRRVALCVVRSFASIALLSYSLLGHWDLFYCQYVFKNDWIISWLMTSAHCSVRAVTWVPYSQRYLVLGLVGLVGLVVTVKQV